jgi:hypothetical protein
MKTRFFTLALFVSVSALYSCGSADVISTHKGKEDQCFYDKRGTIKPYKTDEYRVTERYLFAPEKD